MDDEVDSEKLNTSIVTVNNEVSRTVNRSHSSPAKPCHCEDLAKKVENIEVTVTELKGAIMSLVNHNHESRPQSPTPVTNIRPSPENNDTNDEDRSPEAILVSQMEEYKKVQHLRFKQRKNVLIVGDRW